MEEDTEEPDELAVEEDDQVTEKLDEHQDVTEYCSEDRQLIKEARAMDEEISHLAAFAGKPMTEARPCFNMFNKGKCELKGCMYSHTKAAADNIALRKLQEMLKSPMLDDTTRATLKIAESKLLEKVKPPSVSTSKTIFSRTR